MAVAASLPQELLLMSLRMLMQEETNTWIEYLRAGKSVVAMQNEYSGSDPGSDWADVDSADDEEDEDDIEAHEASIQRLKEADDATREMTREEYQHYSDCRQASFTYRKGAPHSQSHHRFSSY